MRAASRKVGLALIALSGFLPVKAVAGPPWPMVQGGAAHQGQSAFPGPSTNTIQWMYHWDGNAALTPPVVGSQGVYFTTAVATAGASQGKALLISVRPDGKENWRFFTNANSMTDMTSSLLTTVPAVDGNENVYFSTFLGSVSPYSRTIKVNAAGLCVSEFGHYGNYANSAPAISSGGSVYYCCGDAGSLGCSGVSYYPGSNRLPRGGPALSADEATVYIGTGSSGTKRLLAVNTSDMTLKWYLEPAGAGDLYGVPLVNGDKIYFSTDSGLYAVQDTGGIGILLWTRTDIPTAARNYGGLALGNNGVLYAGSGSGGRLRALNPTTGADNWTLTLGTGRVTAPILDGGGYIFVGNGNVIYKLQDNGTSGSILWSTTVTGNVQGLALDNGTLYATTDSGNLFAIFDGPSCLTIHRVGEYGGVPWHDPNTTPDNRSSAYRTKDLNLAISSVNLHNDYTSLPDNLTYWRTQASWGRQQGHYFLPRVYFWDNNTDRYTGPMFDISYYWNRLDTFLAAMNLDDFYGIVLAEENVDNSGRPEVLTELYNRVKAKYHIQVYQWWSPTTTVPSYDVPADGWVIDNGHVGGQTFRRYVQRYLVTGVPLVVMPWAEWSTSEPVWTADQWQVLEDQLQVCREYNLPTAFYWCYGTTRTSVGTNFGMPTGNFMDNVTGRVLTWVAEARSKPADYSGLDSADNGTGDVHAIGPECNGEYYYRDSFLTSQFILDADMTGFRHLLWEPTRTLALRSWNGSPPQASLTYRFTATSPVPYPQAQVSVPFLASGSTVSLEISMDNGDTWPHTVTTVGTGEQTLNVTTRDDPQFAAVGAFAVRIVLAGTQTDGQPAARIDDVQIQTGLHDYAFVEDFDNDTWQTRPEFVSQTQSTTTIVANYDQSRLEFWEPTAGGPYYGWAWCTYQLSNAGRRLGHPIVTLAGTSNGNLGYDAVKLVATADNDSGRQAVYYNYTDGGSAGTVFRLDLTGDSRFDNFSTLTVTVGGTVYYGHGWPDLTADRLRVTAQAVGQAVADLAVVLSAMDAVPGNSNWDPTADLDGDAVITSTDLSIVLDYMDRMGGE